MSDPRVGAIPDIHGHAKGEHKPYVEERPIPYSARMLFLWFYHAALRGRPRFMMVADHINYLTFEDPAAVNLVRRALKLAAAGDLYGAAETAGVDVPHAGVVSEGLRRGMRYSIGSEVDNDPRARPDAANIVEAMKPDGLIRSIHFLPIEHPVHGPGWMWPFDNAEFSSLYETLGTERVWELYMSTLLEAIEKLPGHIVGHFYAPAKFGHWPDEATLERYEDQLIAACQQRGMAIEINMRFCYRYLTEETQQRRYLNANLRLLKKAKAHGVGIAIGSDAHSPKDQGEGFDIVLGLLDAAEVNELVFPIAGRLARVALRAIREALEEPVAAAAGAPQETAEAEEVTETRAAAKAERPRAARGTRARTERPGVREKTPPRTADASAAAPRSSRKSSKTAPKGKKTAKAPASAARPPKHKAAAKKARATPAGRSKGRTAKAGVTRTKPAAKRSKKTAQRPPAKAAPKRRTQVPARRKSAVKAPGRKTTAKKTAAKKAATKSRRS
ncbi:MAG: hypothetical protein JO060_04790 [Candidatus Eremiobacteraeota bacterium]|nr:hypothetical protein [Candidatus Eremiobacteraeota bacterium]